jgi:hypothetical protein
VALLAYAAASAALLVRDVSERAVRLEVVSAWDDVRASLARLRWAGRVSDLGDEAGVRRES